MNSPLSSQGLFTTPSEIGGSAPVPPTMRSAGNIIPSGGWSLGSPSVGMFAAAQAIPSFTPVESHPCQSGKACECGGTCASDNKHFFEKPEAEIDFNGQPKAPNLSQFLSISGDLTNPSVSLPNSNFSA